MIQLFKTPQIKIDTANYSNLLHDKIITEFEQEFADYVGADYACSFNSATNAITILMGTVTGTVKVPSMIPPVVLNALCHADIVFEFVDNIDWVGDSYRLTENIVDSAQKVERGQFKKSEQEAMIFSFYPTKPVGGCDGGMIVSNNKHLIEYIRTLSFNGCNNKGNSWSRTQSYIGYKAYMNSIQAEIATQSLRQLDTKKEKLARVRDKYNTFFNLSNTSDHLYRINVPNNELLVELALRSDLALGIHYKAQHKMSIWDEPITLPLSEEEEKHTVSLPFHEDLTAKEIDYVCHFIEKNT